MMFPIEQVSAKTRAGQIHDMLVEKILHGTFPAGTRLKDNELARMFGTSNTPIREALRELEKDGLVEILPYRGCQVKSIDMDEIREVYDVRIALEELAIKLAAQRITDAQMQAMADLVEAYEEAMKSGDMARVVEVGSAFHGLLIEASGNKTLLRILRELQNRIRLTRQMDKLAERLPHLGDHRAILEAIRRNEPERAASMLTDHIAVGKARVLRDLMETPAPQS